MMTSTQGLHHQARHAQPVAPGCMLDRDHWYVHTVLQATSMRIKIRLLRAAVSRRHAHLGHTLHEEQRPVTYVQLVSLIMTVLRQHLARLATQEHTQPRSRRLALHAHLVSLTRTLMRQRSAWRVPTEPTAEKAQPRAQTARQEQWTRLAMLRTRCVQLVLLVSMRQRDPRHVRTAPRASTTTWVHTRSARRVRWAATQMSDRRHARNVSRGRMTTTVIPPPNAWIARRASTRRRARSVRAGALRARSGSTTTIVAMP